MEGNWFLYNFSVKNKCDAYIDICNEDIAAYENAAVALKEVSVKEGLQGKALETFKLQLADYYAVMNLCIEADKQDIIDCDTYKSIANEFFDGDAICEWYNNAEHWRDQFRATANDFWRKAKNFSTATSILFLHIPIPNPYTRFAIEYDSMADDCQAEMNGYIDDYRRYNEINQATASLFSNGKETRLAAKSLLELMDKQCIAGTYDTTVSDMSLIQKATAEFNDKDLGQEIFDQKMEDFLQDHPEYEDMVQRQKEIYALRSDIENCDNDIAKAEMTKNLNKLIAQQKEDFVIKFYIFDDDGNIVGNNLQELNRLGQDDVITFLGDVYESNNATDIDLGYYTNNLSDYEKLDLTEGIKKLKEEIANCPSESAKENMKKALAQLEAKLGKETNSVVIINKRTNNYDVDYITKGDLTKTFAGKILSNTVFANVEGNISRESAENALEMLWRSTYGLPMVKSGGLTVGLSWLLADGSPSISVSIDPKSNIVIAPTFGGGMTVGTEITGKPGFNICLTGGAFLTGDVHNVPNGNASIGVSGGMYGVYGGVDAIAAFDDLNSTIPESNAVIGGQAMIGGGFPGAELHINGGYTPDKCVIVDINIIDIVTDYLFE